MVVIAQKALCPVMGREETVYIYAEANEQGEKKLWFNGCEMYSGDPRCEECRDVQMAAFFDSLAKSKSEAGRL